MNYFNTISPMLIIMFIQTFIAIIAINNLEIHEIDVFFFKLCDLNEEIYVEQPEELLLNKKKNFL